MKTTIKTVSKLYQSGVKTVMVGKLAKLICQREKLNGHVPKT